MNKYFGILLLIAGLSWSSCIKKDTCNAVDAIAPNDAELASLTAFVTSLDTAAQFDSRGFYYRIVKPGTPNHPGICSDIYSRFECTDGVNTTYFTESTANHITFDLSNQIYAWRYAYPMIGMGGEIIIYVPPSLRKGYSTTKAIFQYNPSIPSEGNVVYKLSMIRWN